MPLRPGLFPFLSLAMARLIKGEGDRGVNRGETWLLGGEFEDGIVSWSVSSFPQYGLPSYSHK